MAFDRDALKQKLEDARYKAEGVLSGITPEQKKTFLRLGIMGGVLVVLLAAGAIFVWGGGPSRRDFDRAAQASAKSLTLAETVRDRLASQSEFENVYVSAVAIGGDDGETLMVYGSVPTSTAMESLRRTIEQNAPGANVEWRIGVVAPGDALEPEAGG